MSSRSRGKFRVAQLQGRVAIPTSLALSPENQRLLVCNHDGLAKKMWNLRTGAIEHTYNLDRAHARTKEILLRLLSLPGRKDSVH